MRTTGLSGLAHGVHGFPGPGGQLQVESGVGVGEVVMGHLADALQPVAQGAAVQGQRRGSEVVVAATLQIAGQGLEQLRAFGGVVVEEGAQLAVDERLNRADVGDLGEQPVDTEVLEHGDPLGASGGNLHLQVISPTAQATENRPPTRAAANQDSQ